MTMYVLYGIFGAVALGMAAAALHSWWATRPARKFKDLPETAKLKKVHKFGSVWEVEVLARCMRVYDADGEVDDGAARVGETVIKAGMQLFPNSPMLLVLYANFLMEVRKDGPASRTQLQIAGKHSPSLVERYQIYCTVENSKRLKDAQDGTMDLQTYVEFKRNYRAIIRVHKEVLQMQCDVWRLLLRTTVRAADMDKAMAELEQATARAHQVYKRVLERYPGNGKLLRCYGRFLEDVAHDPPAASRAYTEAARAGGADMLLNMDLNFAGRGKPEFLTSMDINEDAVVVINAEGTVMMVNQGLLAMFGYAKNELEGANVSLLMPQPFAGRHNGYLLRYTTNGEAHILDSVREVVALHKERFVFPVSLCVTKLSGIGPDSIFLGVVRPMPSSISNVRVWVAPNGTILCADQQYGSLSGMPEQELVGRPFGSVTTDPAAVEVLLERCRAASWEELQEGSIKVQACLVHRYLEPIQAEITVMAGGTDSQRLFMFHVRRTDGETGSLLVVDPRLNVVFATGDMAVLLGYAPKRLAKMKLGELLPPPFNALHAKWIKDPPLSVPPTSCRAGQVVHLLSEAGVHVPVRIKIKEHEDKNTGGMRHVIQVFKATPEDFLDDKRLTLEVGLDTTVRRVARADAALFGFRAGDLLGRSLCDIVDIFQDWRAAHGAGNLQLLMLALMSKEMEMPGASWRVRVSTQLPSADGDQVVALPDVLTGAAAPAAHKSKPACMQVEVMEEEDEEEGLEGDLLSMATGATAAAGASGPCVRLTLWRRELLTGVLELDSKLVVRRANPLMGFIVGLPATSLLKQPLHRYLDIPHHTSWEALMAGGEHKRGALKGGAVKAISAVRAFIGPHIDGGTMRLLVQGIVVDGGGKIQVMIHPDTTYQGAHAKLMHVLKLEHLEEGAGGSRPGSASRAAAHRAYSGVTSDRDGSGSDDDGRSEASRYSRRDKRWMSMRSRASRRVTSPLTRKQSFAAGAAVAAAAEGGGAAAAAPDAVPVAAAAADEAGDEVEAPPSEGSGKVARSSSSSSAGGDNNGDAEIKALHRKATNQSEFVASWVRTLSKQTSLAQPPAAESPDGSRPGSASAPAAPTLGGDGDAAAAAAAGTAAVTGGDDGGAPAAALPKRQGSRVEIREEGRGDGKPTKLTKEALSGSLGRKGSRSDAEEEEGQANGNPKGDDSASEGASSASGSQAPSSMAGSRMSGAGDELGADARRSKLLKGLNRLMLGPLLSEPLQRLRHHTLVLLGVMLLAHAVCYIIILSMVEQEHTNLKLVHRQALAMDRSQLMVVRALQSAYCARANVTKAQACSMPLSEISRRMRTSTDEMESFHQGIYLGFGGSPKKLPEADLYELWTDINLQYEVRQDTAPPRSVPSVASLWTMGNRFIAAGREMLYWAPLLQDQYKFSRSYDFLTSTGMGPLFQHYAKSLDLCVLTAWYSLEDLSMALIVLLVVEALVVQLSCTAYYAWLVHRVERARLAGALVMAALPGPVLRTLSSKPPKVLDDSDDDADSNAGDEQRDAGGAGASGADGGRERRASVASYQEDVLLALPAPPVGSGGDGSTSAPGPAGSEGGVVAQVAARHHSDTGSDISGDEGGKPGGSAWSAAPMAAGRRSRELASKRSGSGGLRSLGSLHVNGKTLQRSHGGLVRLVVPLLLWNAALIIIYCMSLVKLNGMQGPLASLNMAGRVIYRYTRVRAVALAAVTQDDDDAKRYWQGLLAKEVFNLESEYETLMYGGVAITQQGSAFTHRVPAGTFESSAFSQAFFRHKGCLRYDQSLCHEPGSKFYEVTNNGIDVMMRRIIVEMGLLAKDDLQDLLQDGPRYEVMYQVGTKDLYEGLQQSAQMFVDFSISRYGAVTQLHTILLVVGILFMVCYVLLLLRPHTWRVEEEARRRSGLLSMVPAELDVRGHVKAVLRRNLASGKEPRQAA